MKSAHALKVAEIVPQGTDAVLLSFCLEDENVQPFRFAPGQYLTLAADVDGDRYWRCYSITSDPQQEPLISVLVRRVAGGRVSNWICDTVQPGERIDVLPPAGRFTLNAPCQSVLLFAGGSGIAPIFALARQALDQGVSKVTLFYANRDLSTAMLLRELEQLQSRTQGRFEIKLWFDAEKGLPTVDAIRDQTLGLEAGDVYLCGPEPFMKVVNEGLALAGFDRAHVHQEDFGAAPDDGDTQSDAGQSKSLTVLIKGAEHTVPVRGSESLLSAMLNAGLQAPHACKVGECASCVCRLEQGAVERLENSVLDDDDAAEGLILACRTRAVSEQIRIRFS